MKTRKTKATQRRDIPPIHPGEVLAEDFMKPLGITEYRLAKETSVPPRRINLIVKGRRPSRPTPRCGSGATSAWRRSSG